MASAERDRAAQRLEAALVEQDRLGERFDAVVGTSTEFGATSGSRARAIKSLRGWLNWVDDVGYRGAQRGPFRTARREPRTRLYSRTGRLRP